MTTLVIAGWRVRFECTPAAVDKAVATRYAAFVVPDGGTYDASVTVILDTTLPEAQRQVSPVMRHGDICELDLSGGYGTINLISWGASLKLRRQHFYPNFEHFLKVLWAYLAFHHGGLLFHCAGLSVDGGVYLFTGQGGSGKSTVVSLSPHAQALNDDLVVLRPAAMHWWAHGTPFWNRQTSRRDGQLASGPVIGIFKLIQDQQVFLEPISVAVASGELVANCPLVNIDPLELPGVMGRCRDVAQAVKVQRLHFRRSSSFWTVLSDSRT